MMDWEGHEVAWGWMQLRCFRIGRSLLKMWSDAIPWKLTLEASSDVLMAASQTRFHVGWILSSSEVMSIYRCM